MNNSDRLLEKFRSRFTGMPLLLQILVLAVLALSLPTAIYVLKNGGIRLPSRAAVTDPVLYFAPSSYSLPPNQTVKLMLDAKAHKIGFSLVELAFDKTKINLAGEITTSSQLPAVISKTSSGTANSTGRIIFALAVCDPLQGQCDPKPIPPSGLIELAQIPITAIQTPPTGQLTTSITVTASGVQRVSDQEVALPFTHSPADITIFPQNITPTPTPPVSPTPTSPPPPGTGSISVDPLTVTKPVSQVFPAVLNFNTNGIPISSLTFRLTYPYTGSVPELDVVNQTGSPTSVIYPAPPFDSSPDWSFPVNSVTKSNGFVTIDFAAANTSTAGFSNTTDQALVTIFLKAASVPAINPVNLTFDMTETKMMSKTSPPVNILTPPANPVYFISSAPTMIFSHKMQGVTVPLVTRTDYLTLTSQVYPPYTYTHPVLSSTDGIFTSQPALSLTNTTITDVGTPYDVLIKSPGYLQKKFGSVTLLPGENITPVGWRDIKILAGDFDSNNILNIIDLGKMLSVYTALSVPVTDLNRIYDIDADASITISDIAQVLSNYTALEIPGD